MHNPRRAKTVLEADRHSLEFTSGQLIIAICGLLLLSLVCFLVGVVAGRFEFGSRVAEMAAESNPAEAVQKALASTQEAAEDIKTALTPTRRPVREEASVAPPPPARPAENKAAAKPSEDKPRATASARSEGNVRFLTDRPSEAATRTLTEPVTAPPATAAAVSTPPPAPQPAAPAETPAPKPATPAAATPPPAPKPAATEAKPAATESAAPKGNYTVQVIAYQVQNKAMAEEYIRNVKNTANLDAEMVKSKDGKYYHVIIGRYPDRASAEKAQAELKKRKGFADCIVRQL